MPRDPGHGNVPGLPSRISRSSGQPEWRGPRPADNQGRRQETARLPHWLAGRLVPPRPHLVGSRDAAPLPHPDHAQRLAGSLVSGDQRAAKVALAEVVGEVGQVASRIHIRTVLRPGGSAVPPAPWRRRVQRDGDAPRRRLAAPRRCRRQWQWRMMMRLDDEARRLVATGWAGWQQMHPLRWLGERDRDFAALRRAGRTAIVMPVMFAVGDKVIGNAEVATFAAFGAFAMLLLVDFGGSMAERLQAQAALAIVGGVLVCLGTLASRAVWLAAVTMAVVGFGVIFAGVVSSVLAGATTALLLAFILPVSLAAPASAVPDRLAGWGMAGGVALVATALLWPAPARDRLRGAAAAACRAMAARLRGGAIAPAIDAVEALHAVF